jgi:hypothetical protein
VCGGLVFMLRGSSPRAALASGNCPVRSLVGAQ